jgi:hypothetical protein
VGNIINTSMLEPFLLIAIGALLDDLVVLMSRLDGVDSCGDQIPIVYRKIL